MMDWTSARQWIFVPVLGLAAIVAVAGYFMPDICEAVYFRPERARVEAAVQQLAVREQAFRRTRGHFQEFGIASTDALQALAVDRQDWPSDTFQFEANLTPQNGLRIRALPRSEAVQALKVDARFFVAELAPVGGIIRSEWAP
jgi:hypothetical protein